MNYPQFFNEIETIKLQDPLSDVLGSFENGIIEFNYLDVVKSAGHSCPTVMGAYLITKKALEELYKNEIPIRGGVKVFFQDSRDSGVTGVIGNVITQITGAGDESGFKGLNGNLSRNNLISFNNQDVKNIKFQRIDNGDSIELIYDHSSVTPMQPNPMGTPAFKKSWQDRVYDIYKNREKVISVI